MLYCGGPEVKKPRIKILGFDKIYDAIHIMILKFNPKEKLVKYYILNESMNEDIKRFNHLREYFNIDLDQECSIFFDCSYKQMSFFTTYYREIIYERDFIEFDDFIAGLKQDNDLKNKILSFYFEEYEDDESLLSELLLSAKYDFSDEIAKGLVRLILFFDYVKEKLISNLEKVGNVLEFEYSKYREFLDKQRGDNCADEIRFLNFSESEWYKRQNEIQVKFALINQYVIWRGDFQNSGGMILGISYERNFNAMWNLDITLIDFCEVLGDKVRFEIIEKLRDNGGGMSIADIARVTGISISNAIYHVEKLKKVKLVRFNMRGKTAYYYVNSESIRLARMELLKLEE